MGISRHSEIDNDVLPVAQLQDLRIAEASSSQLIEALAWKMQQGESMSPMHSLILDPTMQLQHIEHTFLSASQAARTALNAASPIHRLPAEMLTAIFLFVPKKHEDWRGRRDLFLYILKLAHVCRHWRAVATGIPRLWTHISQTLPYPAQAMLVERSGNAPLTIGLRGKLPNALLASLLQHQPEHHRVVDVRWDDVNLADAAPHLTPASSLETLTLAGDDPIASFRRGFQNVPPITLFDHGQSTSLRVLFLKDVDLLPADRFPNLTSLCIQGLNILYFPAKTPLVRLLISTPHLVNLMLISTAPRIVHGSTGLWQNRLPAGTRANLPALRRCVFRGLNQWEINYFLLLMPLSPAVAISIGGVLGGFRLLREIVPNLPLLPQMTKFATRSVAYKVVEVIATGPVSGIRIEIEDDPDSHKVPLWHVSLRGVMERFPCEQIQELWLMYWPIPGLRTLEWFLECMTNVEALTVADKYLRMCIEALASRSGSGTLACGRLRNLRIILGEYDAKSALGLLAPYASLLNGVDIILSCVPAPAPGRETGNTDLEELFTTITYQYLPERPRIEIPAICEADFMGWSAWA
ncbi:uncharacterized protein B0H18DRAFT_968474 [Fomitopsis serialis]|uniref:uncharacterized protein n=1 Tax=Fomitopsis serialis TaxID=139415 RepID=UPI0020074AD6|nr:uncharacterized protein B0H18DRAFT_968474 [Neoantrodia serialis]KAH9938730.1 hypothetical protein B0H18DRAFT_968474 [Neoantrodia serialis]